VRQSRARVKIASARIIAYLDDGVMSSRTVRIARAREKFVVAASRGRVVESIVDVDSVDARACAASSRDECRADSTRFKLHRHTMVFSM